MRYRHRSATRNSRFQNDKGRAAVTATERLAQELGPLGLLVRTNGYGFRIECGQCGWTTSSGVVQAAIDHARQH